LTIIKGTVTKIIVNKEGFYIMDSFDLKIVLNRIKIVAVILSTLLLCLELRLYKVMVVDNSFALGRINQQMYKSIMYYDGFEFKGDIYDRNLKKLTNDGYEYRAIIHPGMVWNKLSSGNKKYEEALKLICNDTNSGYDNLEDRIEKEYEGSQQAVILTVSQQAMTEIGDLNLTGIYTKVENRKFGDSVGINITSSFINNTINSNDLKYEDSTDMKIFNLITRHTRRIIKVPVDAAGNNMPGLSMTEEVNDQSYYDTKRDAALTIDYNIQKIAEGTLNDLCHQDACVSIIDIKTGEVLAMASKDKNGWERNMVTYSGNNYAYNPGSIFKIIVLAAALEEGKVDFDTKFLCSGRSSTTGISCYKQDGHGIIGLEDAFAFSCNVYFIELARTLGPEKIISMAEKFGFSDKVLGFSRESKGMLYRDKRDLKYDIGNIAIGQKDIMVTPIQVCDMISTIANGGIRKKPFIIKSLLNPDGSIYEDYSCQRERVLKTQTALTMQNLLKSVVEKGTGKNADIAGGVAGKTGTPQRGVKTSSGQYEHEDGWFAGYFPYNDPKFAVSLYVEDIGQADDGRSLASLIFKCIAEKILVL